MHSTPPRFRTASLLTVLVLSLAGCLGAQSPPPPAAKAAPALDTEESKVLYALGLAVAQNLGNFNLTAAELEVVTAGFSDAILKQPAKVELAEYGPKIQTFAQARQTAAAEVEKAESAKFIAKMAAEPGASVKPSGLIVTEITPGTGASPTAGDTVTVHYRGTLRDGTVFDSSHDRGQPATFPLGQVIPCWTEGVQTMKVGGKSRLVCPSAIGYGDRGAPPKILPGAALSFEVELISIGAAQ